MRSLALLLGGGLIGLVIGFLAARQWPHEGPEPVYAPPAPQARPPAPVEQPPAAAVVQPRQPAKPEITTLREILTLSSDFEQTTTLYDLIRNADEAQIQALLAEAAKLEQDSEARAATSILYARYAELNPKAALAHVEGDGTPFVTSALASIFHAWSPSDFDAALEAVRSLDDAGDRSAAASHC